MDSPTIQVNIVDSHGTRQTFKVQRVGLDCGAGLIEIRPDEPAFCRGFDRGILTLDVGDTVTTVNITGGMASLTGHAVHVVCEKAVRTPSGTADTFDPITPTKV